MRWRVGSRLGTALAGASAVALIVGGCASPRRDTVRVDGLGVPIDPDATSQTVALYRNLRALAGEAVLFGHQDDLAYGRGWAAEAGRSDVKDVVGAYPAVLGFDVGRLELGADANIDNVNFENMKRWIRDGYRLGSVITVSWHSVNPVTGGGYGKNTAPSTIAQVLPGGNYHDVLVAWLQRFAVFVRDLTDPRGNPIPLVFRPYHEQSGNWFWWGVGNNLNPVDDYVQLWRFTVDYLQRVEGLHNLLWASSPDSSQLNPDTLDADYLSMYPGDDYVDVMGIDDYVDPGKERFAGYVRTLETLSTLADQHHKLAALTETAPAPGPQPWSGFLLKAQRTNERTRRVVWVLMWRNTGSAPGAPYLGSPTAPDFVQYYDDDFTMFSDGLPNLYATSPGRRSPAND